MALVHFFVVFHLNVEMILHLLLVEFCHSEKAWIQFGTPPLIPQFSVFFSRRLWVTFIKRFLEFIQYISWNYFFSC